jgi:hypothetical protein
MSAPKKLDLPLDIYISFFYQPIRNYQLSMKNADENITLTHCKICRYKCSAYTMKHHYEYLTGIYYNTETFISEMEKLGYRCGKLDNTEYVFLKINKNLDDKHFNRLQLIFRGSAMQHRTQTR